MAILDVRHIKQAGKTHCGAACLEMVYKFFGVTNVSQKEIWQRRKTLRPDGSGYYIKTQSMIDDAINEGFYVFVGQICLEEEKCKESLKSLLASGLPVIVCRQWVKNSTYGHFVVVVGLERNQVIHLDPELDQRPQRKGIKDFIREWQPRGQEVIGGQFIVVGNEKDKIQIRKIHLTRFEVPTKLRSFCLESIDFSD